MLTQDTHNRRETVEITLTLLAARRLSTAQTVLSRFEDGVGPLAPMLSSLILAETGAKRAAQKQLAKLTLPRATADLMSQVVALRALVAAGDRRAGSLLKRLQAKHSEHPEVQLAKRMLEAAP